MPFLGSGIDVTKEVQHEVWSAARELFKWLLASVEEAFLVAADMK